VIAAFHRPAARQRVLLAALPGTVLAVLAILFATGVL